MVHTAQPYLSIPGDPLQARIYTLSNGFRLFLSVNKKEPRVYTHIVVRAGSKQDPADTTGLAHYMEHMLFKGTSRIGAVNWEQEKVLLEEIAQCYEAHRHAKDEAERRRIYAEIDRLSFEAARLVAPSEYDKLAGAIGAKATNAYTWVEQTVYINDIPSNEIERWMRLESERFRMMALRLFHTELETVYEEFNINQDRDFRKVNSALYEALFPSHPYGTQTTMGRPEHLRNPSMVNIQRFFESYYVPGNMALILSGDFDPEEVVAWAETYFGSFEPRPVPPFEFEQQAPVPGPIRREVVGEEAPYLMMGWRLGNSQSDDPFLGILAQHLLYNQQAGLLDLDLNQRQLVLESEAWIWIHEDYSAFGLYAKPREGQTLEEVEALLLQVLQRLRDGDFPDWLVEAVVKDFKLGEIKAAESNESRVQMMASAFILGIDWARMAARLHWMEQVSKEKITEFARLNFREDNFVAVYKRQGEDTGVLKVEKPPITPVELQREAMSEFARDFYQLPTRQLKPAFVDFDSAIEKIPLADGLHLDYVHNPSNALFRMDYIFDAGKNSDPLLALALQYLPYLGAGSHSPADLQTRFFRLGLSLDVVCKEERSYLSVSGLEESFDAGLELIEYILANVRADEAVWHNLVSDILTQRENAKSDRSVILRQAMANYAKHGPQSPFTFRLSAEALKDLNPETLADLVRKLADSPRAIHYYGQKKASEVVKYLQRYPHAPRHPLPPLKAFPELDTESNRVLFVDFPIVQADVLLVSKGTPHFNLAEHLMRDLYNDYFGYGLSSIVFQEIRESKALAYSTYAFYSSPRRQNLAHYLQAYVGTQPDKLREAIPAMRDILQNMPVDERQIEQARLAILKKIETERMTPSEIYWTWRANQDLGHPRDLRRDLYERMRDASVRDLLDFQERYVKNRGYTFLVLGDQRSVDLSYLESFGPLTQLSLESVFGDRWDARERLRNSPPSPVLELAEPMLVEKGVRVFVKRDDLLSLPVEPDDHAFCGNKWRKMKYNLLTAREQGFRTLCTFGGAFSNHIAACAAAGPLFGFQTIGVIRGEECLPLNPTLAFARRCGMVLHFMDRSTFREKAALDIAEWTQSDRDTTYVLPEGGSNALALQGCRELAQELAAQCAPDVCCAPCGTGATLAGLVQGLQKKVQVLGISVLKGGFMKKSVAAFLPDNREGDASPPWEVVADYHFGGYARYTPELMQFMQAFEARHGIPLDQVYTVKLFFGVWDLIRRDRFPRGTRLCVVHTGGLQGRQLR